MTKVLPFFNNRHHYVKIPGGIRQPYPVLSGVSHGIVLDPLLLLIIDVNKDISPGRIKFEDDTMMYLCINHISLFCIIDLITPFRCFMIISFR